MMGRQTADQAQLFYSFNLDERIPKTHPLYPYGCAWSQGGRMRDPEGSSGQNSELRNG